MRLKRAKAAKNAYLFAFSYDGNIRDHLRTAMLHPSCLVISEALAHDFS
jgi:hypothetical protein